jgi:hypothetical protein
MIDLGTIPSRIASLPRDARGYPVPWFVAWLRDGKPVPAGTGAPDFRVVKPGAIPDAHNHGLCWICGDTLGAFRSFVIGPMCALNRISAEPPSHLECAEFAARVCPFLSRPKERRNEKDVPDHVAPAGHMIRRNPGVALVWTTKRYKVVSDGNGGALFDVGKPEHVRWYACGRTATRAEVIESIESGLPILRESADGPRDLAEIESRLRNAMALVPKADVHQEATP